MRFLVDECTGPAVAHWLHEQNHEVFSVYEESRGANYGNRPEKQGRKKAPPARLERATPGLGNQCSILLS